LPAGSRIVPLTVVVALPVQVRTMQAMPLQGPELPVPGQTFGIPVPPLGGGAPQVMPLGQGAVQLSVPPHPSPIVPQYWPPPATVQEIGWQLGSPQTFMTPRPPQVAGAWHVPQSRTPPQPSPIMPQKRDVPTLQVNGTQFDKTHTPDALHVALVGQPPQFIARPQPSPTVPQYWPPLGT